MLIGLVNSGIMNLSQTVSVIIGANVGTTITAWMLSLTGIQENAGALLKLLKPEFIELFDFSNTEEEHDTALKMIKKISRSVDIPIVGAGNVHRFEDVKKLLYAGCCRVCLNFSKESNVLLTEEVAKRFGRDKIVACIMSEKELLNNEILIKNY